MRILHIIPTYMPAYRYGGPVKSVHELNRWLVKRGLDLTVYTTNLDGSSVLDVPTDREVMHDGVRIRYFPIAFRPWQYSRVLHCVLRETVSDFDAVHITSVFLSASTLGAWYARKYGKPYVISPRGSLMTEPLRKNALMKRLYLSLIEKRNLRDAAAIHFTAEIERDEYFDAGLPARLPLVIQNGFDLGDLGGAVSTERIAAFKKQFSIPSDAEMVLFLSRLSWKKGLDTLVPAYADVVKRVPKTILVIAGGDDERYGRTLDALVRAHGLQGSVRLTGMLTGSEKRTAYEASDLFVLPSYAENFGIVVLEALACGTPVVITDRVGVAPFVAQAQAGAVVKKDVVSVAEAIVRLLSSPRERAAMSARGKALVASAFQWEHVADQFLRAYNEIIEQSRTL